MNEDASGFESSTRHAESPSHSAFAKRKSHVLLLLILLVAMTGVVGALADQHEDARKLVLLIFGIAAQLLILKWCSYDSSQREQFLPDGLRIAIGILPMIGFPIYCIRSRGTNGYYTIVVGILFFGLLLIIAFLTATTMAILVGPPLIPHS